MKATGSRIRLERLRRKISASLPAPDTILRGSVFIRRRRCGVAGCRCAKGKGHATAYLAASMPGGRTQQISLPQELVDEARRWVEVYRRWWRAVERISAINREFFRKRWIEPRAPRKKA